MIFISRGWQTIQMYLTELQITFFSDFLLWILTGNETTTTTMMMTDDDHDND